MIKTDGDVIMNMADYFRTESNIGSYNVYNLRTGEKTVVPWGTLDWINGILGSLVTVVILSGAGYFVYTLALKLSH